jgi:FixJ family two-component response regulator
MRAPVVAPLFPVGHGPDHGQASRPAVNRARQGEAGAFLLLDRRMDRRDGGKVRQAMGEGALDISLPVVVIPTQVPLR